MTTREQFAPTQPQPPVPTGCGDRCPQCGERDHDALVWDADAETVTCQTCGCCFQP